MEHLNIENYDEDFSLLIGKVDTFIESIDLGKVYKVLPNVKGLGMGNTKQIARIVTDFDLKVGKYYAFKGHIETLKLNSEIVPALFVTEVKVIPKTEIEMYSGKSLTESYKLMNFSYITNLKVEKIVGKNDIKLVKMVKMGENRKFFFKTDLVGATMCEANKDIVDIKVGDTINILCGIDHIEHLDTKKQFEVGLNIFKINPSEGSIEELKYYHDNIRKTESEMQTN